MFIPSKLPTGPVEQTSSIRLQFADITIAKTTGEVDISWSDEAPIVKAKVGRLVWNKGLTKNIYKVRLVFT